MPDPTPMPEPARPRRRARLIALALAVAAAALVGGLAIRAYVVPAAIRGALQDRVGGLVTFDDWWLDGSSAGVLGLTVRQSMDPDSPVLARAGRVATDLSLPGIVRGRRAPGSVEVDGLVVDLPVSADGKPQLPAFRSEPGAEPAPIPKVAVRDARVTIRQEGRPEFVVEGVEGVATPRGTGLELEAKAVAPGWGRWSADGSLDGDAWTIVLASAGATTVDPGRLASLPFVPAETWRHVVPKGDVRVKLAASSGAAGEPEVRTEIALEGTTLDAPTLGLVAEDARGRVEIDGGVVRIAEATGDALGGKVRADGTLDFRRAEPAFALALGLDGIDVAKAPERWQLGELEATGSLTGHADLLVTLHPDGPDLTGSTGTAEITGGSLQGIPVKSLQVEMSAEGPDLHYGSPADSGADPATGAALSRLVGLLVAIQQPPAPDEPQAKGTDNAKEKEKAVSKPRPKGFGLRPISTKIELEDVDLRTLVVRAEGLAGIKVPFPVAGKLSLKARATIPIGSLREMKAYTFKGEGTLTGASIAGVDLGRVDAALELAEGVLTLTDFRGRLVEQPGGDAEHPPGPTEPVPAEGPLPPGGFRGTLRAGLDPKGRLTARFEGEQLPLAELAAPALPRPTPLSGKASLEVVASGEVESLGDVRAWAVRGRLAGDRFAWRDQALGAVAARFALEAGLAQLEIPSAEIAGKPIRGTVRAEARWPEQSGDPIRGTIALDKVDAAALAGLVPGGGLELEGRADGTVAFRVPPDGSAWDGDVRLTAPGLKVQGIEADDVTASVRVAKGALAYDLAAGSLGGKIRFRGEVPLDPDAPAPASDGEIQAANLGIGPLLAALKVAAPVEGLDGRAAARANVKFGRNGGGLRARGIAEVRDLRLGDALPLGGLSAEFALAPGWWRLDRIEGDLLGGRASGQVGIDPAGAGPAALVDGDGDGEAPGPPIALDVRVDRAPLARLLAPVPELAAQAAGEASLRARGRVAQGVRLEGEVAVPRGAVAGVALAELRVPLELTVSASGAGTARSRSWSGRVAGGRVRGDARVDFGAGRSFEATAQLADLDLESITRLDPNTSRPATGRISGRLAVSGADPTDPARLRGRLDLTLADAAVFTLPVFRELGRFLGAAQGGVFETGELEAAIGNRQVVVERLDLAGRLAQVHASGTVGFNGQLQLEVLVNTGQIIPETGQALLAVIPGLSATGRRQENLLRVGNFFSNRLLKLRVGGTLRSPSVQVDPAVLVTEAAIGFFGATLGLPLNLFR